MCRFIVTVLGGLVVGAMDKPQLLMVVKFCKKILFFFWDSLLGLFEGTKKAYVLVKPFARIREAFRKRYNIGCVPRDAYLHYTTPTKATGPERSGKKESVAGSSTGKRYIYGGIGLLVILVATVAAFTLSPREKGTLPPPRPKKRKFSIVAKKLNFEIAPNKAPFFVGRKKEMDALAPDLKKKTDKLVVLPPITGVGGIGKTALVLELIEKYATKYNYIAWIDAASAQDIERSYRQIAKTLGIKIAPKKALKEEIHLIEEALKEKRVLYVFDNAPDLQTIQHYLKKGHVLITSPNSDTAQWKQDGYNVPDPLFLEAFSIEEALELAEKMGQNKANKDLTKLIEQLPKYPLFLKLFLRYISVYHGAPQTLPDEVKKGNELINALKTYPQELNYTEQNVFIIENTLRSLQSIENGKVYLQLLQQVAYLAKKPVPLHFVLSKLDNTKDEKAMRDILSILEKNGLISQGAHNIQMHSLIQLTISIFYPLAAEQREKLLDLYRNNIDGTPHAFIAEAYHALGKEYYANGRHNEAITCYNKAPPIYNEIYGKPFQGKTMRLYWDLGQAVAAQKKAQEEKLNNEKK